MESVGRNPRKGALCTLEGSPIRACRSSPAQAFAWSGFCDEHDPALVRWERITRGIGRPNLSDGSQKLAPPIVPQGRARPASARAQFGPRASAQQGSPAYQPVDVNLWSSAGWKLL